MRLQPMMRSTASGKNSSSSLTIGWLSMRSLFLRLSSEFCSSALKEEKE